jgi:hypothetical protein
MPLPTPDKTPPVTNTYLVSALALATVAAPLSSVNLTP